MLTKILVAFDLSEASFRAFDFACELARPVGATVLVVAVIRLPEPTTSLELEEILNEARRAYEQGCAELRARQAANGLDVRTEIADGHPAEHIVGCGDREAVDLIVMGRRGMSRVARWMLGSISERVLRYATCPVAVVK